MGKPKVNHVASSGIIYRQKSPDQVFLEMKDGEHPIGQLRNKLSLIGGNWIGEGSKDDQGPLDTFRREVAEEFSVQRISQSPEEIRLLDLSSTKQRAGKSAPTGEQKISAIDLSRLEKLKKSICGSCVPFGVFINIITKTALDQADPNNQRDDIVYLLCVWLVPLDEESWFELSDLQKKFGNLSNESVTVITSLDQIINKKIQAGSGYDHVLKRFFLAMGLTQANQMSIVEGTKNQYEGTALATYDDYIAQYDINKKPAK